MSPAELGELRAHPQRAPLMEAERELLLFVLAAVRTPEKVTRAEVERLRGLGWTSRNIFDAVYHGAQMVALSLRLKAFVK